MEGCVEDLKSWQVDIAPDLFYLSWNLTMSCNLHCMHCYVEAGQRQPGELSLGEVKHIASAAKALGVRGIFLAGGEPLLRADIYDLVRSLASEGVTVCLNSNGTLLTKSVAAKLLACGLAGISVGLDAVSRQNYTKFRGADKFDRVITGLNVCAEVGLPVNIDFTLTQRNYDDLGLIHDFAMAHGCVRVTLKRFVPEGRGWLNQTELLLSPERERLAMETWYQQSESKKTMIASGVHDPLYIVYLATIGVLQPDEIIHMDCNAGAVQRGWLAISPNGSVHPCPLMRQIELGNVRNKSWPELVNGDLCQAIRVSNRQPLGKCCTCRHYNICRGGCKAYSLKVLGDYRLPDPLCWLDPNEQDASAYYA